MRTKKKQIPKIGFYNNAPLEYRRNVYRMRLNWQFFIIEMVFFWKGVVVINDDVSRKKGAFWTTKLRSILRFCRNVEYSHRLSYLHANEIIHTDLIRIILSFVCTYVISLHQNDDTLNLFYLNWNNDEKKTRKITIPWFPITRN